MRREIEWGEDALAEVEGARARLETRTVGRGLAFIGELDGLVASLLMFPLQGSLMENELPFPTRKSRLRAFGFLLYYTVYPSVDFQTGEVLDVIHVLACRHERQGEPNWETRDPFRL